MSPLISNYFRCPILLQTVVAVVKYEEDYWKKSDEKNKYTTHPDILNISVIHDTNLLIYVKIHKNMRLNVCYTLIVSIL